MKNLIQILVVLGVISLWFSCGGDIATEFEGDGTAAFVESGADWATFAKQCSGSLSTDLQTNAEAENAKEESKSWWCLGSWMPGCTDDSSMIAAENEVKSQAIQNTETCKKLASMPRNTKFCKVDSQGHVASQDAMDIHDGSRIFGTGGGCVNRPIREAWAVILNLLYMKPGEITSYGPVPRLDLTDPSKKVFFAFDINNEADHVVASPEWVIRWYHSIPFGTYEEPNQIVINYQKVEGTTYIPYLKGGYVLDRVTPTVTSFVMSQSITAKRYDTEHMRNDISTDLSKVRTGTPNWDCLKDRAKCLSKETWQPKGSANGIFGR